MPKGLEGQSAQHIRYIRRVCACMYVLHKVCKVCACMYVLHKVCKVCACMYVCVT